jgi:hypothetical protein
MDWNDVLTRLETTREAEIETRRTPDAPAHRTIVWPVVQGGQLYLRSLHGRGGRWFRELSENPEATLHVDGEAVPVRAVTANDSTSIERASEGLRRKYADSPHLESMLRDEILDTTVRLEPRQT